MTRRRSWTQRTAIGLATLVGVAMLCAAAASAYVASLLARVDYVAIANLDPVDDEPPTASDLRESTDATDDALPALGAGGAAENYLIIGSDDITGIDPDEAILTDREDEAGQSLADTIMLLRLDPAARSASLLSIPRDLWVTIQRPDDPFEFKINTAFNLADRDARAARMVATVQVAFDVPIQHFVHVNWAGFRELVDIIGGVDVCFDAPQRDVKTGFIVETAGVHHLDGDQSLAYVRSRTMQEQGTDGRWRLLDQRADLSRIPRQQQFLRTVLDQTAAVRSITDLRQGQRLVSAVVDAIEIDDTLAISDLIDLVRRYEAIGGSELRTFQLDVADGVGVLRGVEYPMVQLIDTPANELAIDIFRGIEAGDVVPSRVAVSVDGAGASELVAGLRDLDFEAVAGGTAGAIGRTSAIRYGSGGEDAALLVAAAVAGPVRYEIDPELSGLNVVVSLGSSGLVALDELRAPAAEPPPAPTTIAPPVTTSDTSTTTTTVASICAA